MTTSYITTRPMAADLAAEACARTPSHCRSVTLFHGDGDLWSTLTEYDVRRRALASARLGLDGAAASTRMRAAGATGV